MSTTIATEQRKAVLAEAEAIEADVPEREVQPGTLEAHALEYEAAGGTLTKAGQKAVRQSIRAGTEIVPAAFAARKAAEHVRRNASRISALEDAEELAVRKSLDPERETFEEYAERRYALAARRVAAAQAIANAKTRDAEAEIGSPTNLRNLSEAWSGEVAFVADEDSMTIADLKAAEARADALASSIERLYMVAIGSRSLEKRERDALRRAFAERPAVMPTIAAIRDELRNSPEERARRDRERKIEAQKAAEKAEARRTAQLAAAARSGHTFEKAAASQETTTHDDTPEGR